MSKHELATVPTEIVVPDYGTASGEGFEGQTSEDISIPFLNVLQSNSPEIAGDPAYRIKGAQIGMLMNSVTKELFDGDEGVVFQPAATDHQFYEWKPRSQGGGLVGRHAIDSRIVLEAKQNQEFGKYKLGNNDLIETFSIAGLLHRSSDLDEVVNRLPMAIVVSFTKTKISEYKRIMTRLWEFKGTIPLYAHRLLITTNSETNSFGTFSNFKIKPVVDDDIRQSLIPNQEPYSVLLKIGQELMKQYKSGAAKANTESISNENGKPAGPGNGADGKEDDIPF